jgi:hypothetical protein
MTEPKKYKSKFHPDGTFDPKKHCKGLIEHMASGYTFSSYAAVLGLSHTTISKWCESHPEFALARDIGKQRLSMGYQDDLKALAKGETKGSAKAISFALKNHDPDNFKEKIEIDNNQQMPFLVDTGIIRAQLAREMEEKGAIEAEAREIPELAEIEIEDPDVKDEEEEEIEW